jgi:hypothetical protein
MEIVSPRIRAVLAVLRGNTEPYWCCLCTRADRQWYAARRARVNGHDNIIIARICTRCALTARRHLDPPLLIDKAVEFAFDWYLADRTSIGWKYAPDLQRFDAIAAFCQRQADEDDAMTFPPSGIDFND